MIDVETLMIKDSVTQKEAILIANSSIAYTATVVEKIEFISTHSNHTEYRKKNVPLYAVTYKKPQDLTVYVAQQTGKVEAIRNNQWRIYDVLWMLHTMDYVARDNFNNWLLRIFSVLGLLTILSGFGLFFVSSRKFKRKINLSQKL
ncbi:MAG: hypothetical protein HC892_21345 [Saprospiraceae bacterium]|nr:hypothetical protein [Saprospiraceae bacterium]